MIDNRQLFDDQLTEDYAAYMSAGGKEPWWDRNWVMEWGVAWVILAVLVGMTWLFVRMAIDIVAGMGYG